MTSTAVIFSGHASAQQDVLRKLVIASDVRGTLIKDGGQVNKEYLKALVLLKSAGHNIYFFSSVPNTQVMLRVAGVLPQVLEELKSNPDIARAFGDALDLKALGEDFLLAHRKSAWKSVIGAEKIDVLIDDMPEALWCNGICLDAKSPALPALVKYILSRPERLQDGRRLHGVVRSLTLSSLPQPPPVMYG